MLTSIQSAVVAPEVNLRNSLHAGEKAHTTLALKPRGDVTRSPKQGYQWIQEKDLCPPKIYLKKGAACQYYSDGGVDVMASLGVDEP